MAILQQTPTKLTLQFRPWLTWILGGFNTLVWIPLTVTVFFPLTTSYTLNCQRVQQNQGDCQLVTSNLLQSNTKTIPLPELQGARFDTITNNDGRESQQVKLLTKQGELLFGYRQSYHRQTSVSNLKYIVSEVNNFVKDTQQPSLNLQIGNPLIGFAVFGVMGVNFLWYAFCSDVITCDFDKSRGSIIKKRQWFFLITKTVEYQLLDIIDVKVEEKRQRNGKSYRVKLLLNSHKDLPLTAYYTNYWKSQVKMEANAEAIKKFLNRQQIYLQD